MSKTPFLTTLEFLVADQGWNKRQLSDVTGIPYHRLNEWFRGEGKVKPNGDDLSTLVKTFGVTPEFLLSGQTTLKEVSLRENLTSRLASCGEDELRELQQYLDFLDQKRRSAPPT